MCGFRSLKLRSRNTTVLLKPSLQLLKVGETLWNVLNIHLAALRRVVKLNPLAALSADPPKGLAPVKPSSVRVSDALRAHVSHSGSPPILVPVLFVHESDIVS